MQMTTEEIIRNYTEAKDKSKQIGILADLNGCDKEKIRAILISKGCQMPTKGRPKKETVEKVTWPKEDLKIEDLVQKDEFESPIRPMKATIKGGHVKKITFKNIDTGEETVACAEEKLFLPEVVKGLVIERISQIEFEITKLKLDKEELEDFLEQFADDV